MKNFIVCSCQCWCNNIAMGIFLLWSWSLSLFMDCARNLTTNKQSLSLAQSFCKFIKVKIAHKADCKPMKSASLTVQISPYTQTNQTTSFNLSQTRPLLLIEQFLFEYHSLPVKIISHSRHMSWCSLWWLVLVFDTFVQFCWTLIVLRNVALTTLEGSKLS